LWSKLIGFTSPLILKTDRESPAFAYLVDEKWPYSVTSGYVQRKVSDRL
jgi:hypothetical protein